MSVIPLKLLLADDDTDDCTFFQEALEELPVKATLGTVNDGVQLMQLLLQNEESLPDALYLDLNMPRKTGYECLREIKQHKKLKELPVIIFSTSFDKEVLNSLYESGAHYYIRKPSEFSKLKKLIYHSINIIAKTNKGKPAKENFVINDE